MPAPQNNQGFVAPQSGGAGTWLGKLFGGIGQERQARSMAQIQLDLHKGRSDIDTAAQQERVTHKVTTETAGKIYGDKQEKFNTRTHIKNVNRITNNTGKDKVDKKTGKVTRLAKNDPNRWNNDIQNITSKSLTMQSKYNPQNNRDLSSDNAPDSYTPPAAKNTAAKNTAAKNTAAKNTAAKDTAAKNTAAKDTAAAPSKNAPAVTEPKVKAARQPRAPKAGM
jgi:hypothetical protein